MPLVEFVIEFCRLTLAGPSSLSPMLMVATLRLPTSGGSAGGGRFKGAVTLFDSTEELEATDVKL